jgi:protein-S-isoprenylcysteine O-methyltransferase
MIGGLLILVGLLLRVLAIIQLRHNFTMALSVPDCIVTTGIYRYLRHPSYVGSFLVIVGGALIHVVLGLGLLTMAFFLARITQEEAILSRFPKYQEYRTKTGMVFPRIRIWQRG